MGVHVAIPAAYSGEERDRLHRWTIERWKREYVDRHLWRLAYATDRARRSEDEPPRTTDSFNHPKAINVAVRAHGGGLPDDVLVIADADTFPDPVGFRRRIEAARRGYWSAPARYVNLSAATTEKVLAASGFAAAALVAEGATDHLWEGDTSWAGIVVIRRDEFDAVGGYDERYDGWWADDVAFAMSVETLVRPVERLGTVYHLWHEVDRSRTYDRPGFSETWATTMRYLAAHGDEDAMRALLAERT